MAMKTEVKKIGDTVVVSMDGKLDFEMQDTLKQNLSKIIRQANSDSVAKKIIVDLENLEFVGSSGISSFVQTMKDFNAASNTKPRYCNVKNEFRRVMKAFDEQDIFEFYDNQDRARKSFDQ